MPSAYDPVRNVDVDIGGCHPVHAADDAADLGEGVIEIVERDFKHDPVEACQGSYTLLIEKECPECGCNRARESVQTLAGIGAVSCTACDYMHAEP